MDLQNMQQVAVEAERLLKLLAHRSRLLVLCNLAKEEQTAGELEAIAGLSQSALSQHLAKLREENIVTTRREAQRIYYSLSDDTTRELIVSLYRVFCKKEEAIGLTGSSSPVLNSASTSSPNCSSSLPEDATGDVSDVFPSKAVAGRTEQ
ncbi:ArsR/SmtB family transcription factor [Marinibactrum halimedae]|uniref:HTH arsR-type domain-containing protein n=1 Tax=Marinibactrum halimedae TaxID=1444977 RepID=A0AA37T4Z3_9GAMM|nr:metalloregulator ArsR/SmtB family transcription factor [Marinibactrum halimedae]MCD9458977.1 metalloregulator ArsR/SmtB family transcription factor [Marinibactrum halimedae]GLS26894.1 hypothetical protein GCM10007877_26130 [Marinibactrum halimedae]